MIFYIDHIYFTLFKVTINVLFDVPSTWNHWLVAVTEPLVLMACTKKPWCLCHFIAAHGSLLWESREWSKLYGCAEIFIPDADGRASSELCPDLMCVRHVHRPRMWQTTHLTSEGGVYCMHRYPSSQRKMEWVVEKRTVLTSVCLYLQNNLVK